MDTFEGASMIAEKAKRRIRDYYADPSDEKARRLLDWAAKQGFPKESTAEQIEHGADLDHAYVISAMKELAQLEIGQFVVGRRKNKSRIIWKVRLGDLGRWAQGQAVEFDEPKLPVPYQESETAQRGAEDIVHFYQLGPERRLSLSLPSNLTPHEARWLADFILSLPFEDGMPSSPPRDQE
jgi:hypothetical protein